MFLGPNVPDIFPSKDSMTWRPLSSAGSPRKGSPESSVIWSAPTSCHPSLQASSPSPSDTARRLFVRSPDGTRATHQEPGAYFPDSPNRLLKAEMTGPPRSLRNPNAYMPCSSTPVGSWCQCRPTPRYCLPHLERRRLPHFPLSRLNRTACKLPVYASQRGLPHRYATLGSGCRHA